MLSLDDFKLQHFEIHSEKRKNWNWIFLRIIRKLPFKKDNRSNENSTEAWRNIINILTIRLIFMKLLRKSVYLRFVSRYVWGRKVFGFVMKKSYFKIRWYCSETSSSYVHLCMNLYRIKISIIYYKQNTLLLVRCRNHVYFVVWKAIYNQFNFFPRILTRWINLWCDNLTPSRCSKVH